MTDILSLPFIKGFCRMADDGWNMGWHERNGGNLSYRMKPEEIRSVKKYLNHDGFWISTGTETPGLAGEFFLVTGSGQYFRNTSGAPEENIGIIELDKAGGAYRICRGLTKDGRPTSELPAHLKNHEVKKKRPGGAHRVIYHAHTPNVIALTFVLPLNDEVFTRELWEMMPECPIVFPGGVGVVPWMIPGSADIAAATSEVMRRYDIAVWAHHGTICSGEDFDSAFGLAHTVEKAAGILLKVLSVSPEKRQTVTTGNLRDLAEALGLDLPEAFLYEKQ